MAEACQAPGPVAGAAQHRSATASTVPAGPTASLCHRVQQGGERVQPRTAAVAFPSAPFSPFIRYNQQDVRFITPAPPPSGFGPFSEGSGTSPPGPQPSGAARNEPRLSLRLQSCSDALRRWIPGQSPSGSTGRPARSRSPRDLPKTTRAPALCHARRGPSRFWGVLGTRARALRSRTAHRSFICDFQTSDSSVGATATSGLTDVRKSRHGAKVHKFWLGKTSRLGNLDIWEPPSVPSQALSQEGGRTRMVRMSLDRQGCIYFQLCLYREGNVYSVV